MLPTRMPEVVAFLFLCVFTCGWASGCSDSTTSPSFPDSPGDEGDAALEDGGSADHCEPGQLLCDGLCIDPDDDEYHCGACHNMCTSEQECMHGACQAITCAPGLSVCDRQCVDLQSSFQHCGECDHECLAAESCAAGDCVSECPDYLTQCEGQCVDLDSSNSHCGECFRACPDGQVCTGGTCTGSCPAGLEPCFGGCVNTQIDPANCGGCGISCPSGQICLAAICTVSCQEGLTSCNDRCVDLETDRGNCGECGTECDDGAVCFEGECVITCPQGLSICYDSTCVDLSSDRHNCGRCGETCEPGQVCSGGRCVLSCTGDLSICYNTCVNTFTDRNHCGECGHRCPDGHSCLSGSCTLTCPDGQEGCGTTCSTLMSDDLNCGACGNECSPGFTCQSGNCAAACSGGYQQCGQTCHLLESDPEHCGICDRKCPSGTICRNALCVVPVTGISLNKSSTELMVGTQETLIANVSPTNASDKSLLWSSSNSAVAPVQSSGRVSAIGAGEAIITARTSDGGYTATCLVRVRVPLEGLTVSPPLVELSPGGSANLLLGYIPAEAEPLQVIWSSSNTAVATVDGAGRVQAYGTIGDSTITATTADGRFSATSTASVALVPVSGVEIEPNSAAILPGNPFQFTANVLPPNAFNQAVLWYSDRPDVIDVDSNGLASVVTIGQATIHVLTMEGGFTDSAAVESGIMVTGVTVEPSSLTLLVGTQESLQATVSPPDATDQSVVWSSTNEAVAQVSPEGVVSALSAGNATITATTVVGGLSSSCVLSVPLPVSGITISPTQVDLVAGESSTLSATIIPQDAANQLILWETSNSAAATVDDQGTVTGVWYGEAIITATTVDGGFTSTSSIYVRLFNFTSHTFNTCSAGGPNGPSLIQCRNTYSGSIWAHDPSFFNVNNGIQRWVAPQTGTYLLEAYGASGGGANNNNRSRGGMARGTVNLNGGDVLFMVVGQQGTYQSTSTSFGGGGRGGSGYTRFWAGGRNGHSGGGASDVRIGNGNLANRIVVAGGGGGGTGNGSSASRRDGGGGGGGGYFGGGGGNGGNCSPHRGGGGGTQAGGGLAGGCGTNGVSGGGGNGGQGTNRRNDTTSINARGGHAGGLLGDTGVQSSGDNRAGAGGGGSSFVGGVDGGTTNGNQNLGHGSVQITLL